MSRSAIIELRLLIAIGTSDDDKDYNAGNKKLSGKYLLPRSKNVNFPFEVKIFYNSPGEEGCQ